MAMEHRNPDAVTSILEKAAEPILTILFLAECVLKIGAMGFFWDKNTLKKIIFHIFPQNSLEIYIFQANKHFLESFEIQKCCSQVQFSISFKNFVLGIYEIHGIGLILSWWLPER